MDRSQSKRSFDQLERDAGSDDQAVRGAAMQELSLLVRHDAKTHDRAMRIFRKALEDPKDGWTAVSAARGYEQIVGPYESRAVWLALLRSDNPQVVSSVVLSIRDASFVPALLELLNPGSGDADVKISTMRALGRMHDPAVLPAIAAQLDRPELRAHAIESLADLGDPRHIADSPLSCRHNRRMARGQSRPDAPGLRPRTNRHQALGWRHMSEILRQHAGL
jgi:HEAT repeat protein